MTEIDHTSAVLFAAGSVAIALVLCTVLRRYRAADRATTWLMVSNLSLLGAACSVLSRPLIGFEWSSILVIMFAYAGICFAYFAVLTAEEQPLPWKLLGGVGVLGLAAQVPVAFMAETVAALMLSSSIVNASLTLGMAISVWQLAQRYGGGVAGLLSLPFMALCAGYSIRLAAVIGWGDGGPAILATLLIVVAMAWASVILELALIALRESQARARLSNALEEADAALRARTRFLLTISHDLRTPLNGILGMSELMRQQVVGPLPDAYRAHANEIHASGTELLELVSDLLIVASEDRDLGQDSAARAGTDPALRAESDKLAIDMSEAIRARVG